MKILTGTKTAIEALSSQEGQIAYATDTNEFGTFDGSSWTWGGGGGVTDHGALTGLGDDDHTQYLLATGARAGASGQAQDFGATYGIKADLVAESTVAAGVTVDGLLIKDGLADGVDVSTHASRHDQGGADALSTVPDHDHTGDAGDGAQLDHGAALTGLADDDHTQYLLNLDNVLIVHSAGSTRAGQYYTSISSAISAASAGDVVFIMPGTYTEDLTLANQVHLIGLPGGAYSEPIQGAPAVTIDGQVTIDSTVKCILANLSIYHQDTTASAISAVEATTGGAGLVELQNCSITCLNYSSGNARAVSSTVNLVIYFRNCWLDADSSTGTAYGLYASTGTFYFWNSLFGGNQDTQIYVDSPGSVYLYYTSYDPTSTGGSGTFNRSDALPIRRAIWEVDGTGSEIDADRVDGYHASMTPGSATVPVVDGSSRLILPGMVQLKGAGSPSSGTGLELEWDGTQSDLLSYDRDLAAYKPIRIRGSKFNVLEETTNMLEVDGGQVGIAGTADDILTVNTSTIAQGAHVGSAWVGNWNGGATYAAFAHNSVKGASGSYAVIQSSSGGTYINSASGLDLYFRINNSTVFYWATANVALVVSGTGDIRVGGGIWVGSTASNPGAGVVVASNDGRFGGGVYAGSTGGNPNTGDVVATADGRFGSGVYIGSTATAPGTGECRATAFVSGWLPFSDYSGNGMSGLTTTTVIAACSLGYTCTLKSMYVTAFVATTNNGSNYWTIALKDAGSATLASVNTSSGSAGTWTSYSTTGLSVALTIASNDKFLFIEVSKTGSPGALSLGCPSCHVL